MSAVTLVAFSLEFLVVFLVLAAISGPWYCGWLCPFGAAQEWIGKLGRRVLGGRYRIPRRVHRFVTPVRFILLCLSLLGVGALLFLSDPYLNFISLLGWRVSYVGLAAWTLVGAFLAISFFVDRPFCRFFCVEGAQHGAAGLARLFTIRRAVHSCTGCRRCELACPTQIPVSERETVRSAQCINCFECISACPISGGLRFGPFWRRR